MQKSFGTNGRATTKGGRGSRSGRGAEREYGTGKPKTADKWWACVSPASIPSYSGWCKTNTSALLVGNPITNWRTLDAVGSKSDALPTRACKRKKVQADKSLCASSHCKALHYKSIWRMTVDHCLVSKRHAVDGVDDNCVRTNKRCLSR